PNLGRDLSLMTLWPAVFARVAVWFYEKNYGTGQYSQRPVPNQRHRFAVERPPPRLPPPGT
ncbi:MAG: hypothetical protein ABGZ17_16400, partial [Planctomycetaceae bacterium]